ncbi:MAG TPA: SdpI family protein [Cyclobacteriaceae bacterium]|nr:SdpI family protein [Cyclobacteriaceae bacterium]
MCLLLGGTLMRFLRIKKNHFIGYRTRASMKDEASWTFANRLAGKYMIVIGLLSTVGGLVNHYFNLVGYHIVMIATMGMIILAIVLVEIGLRKNRENL